MSGYLRFTGTGFKPFDDVLSEIENAGDYYHHTAQWQDEGDDGKTLIENIDEKITAAAKEIATLTADLARVTAERDAAQAKVDSLMIEYCPEYPHDGRPIAGPSNSRKIRPVILPRVKVHLHEEQFDGHPHAWCGRSDNAVPSDEFEATEPALRCRLCDREWFPHGQPDWHRQ